MSTRRRQPHPLKRSQSHAATTRLARPLLPLGALAAGFGLALLPLSGAVRAQAAPAAIHPEKAPEATLPVVKVQATAEGTGKDAYQAVTTTVGKGRQDLRDIPQSVTVITEKLIDDKNLDTLKAALHSVPGIAFEAGEGGAIGDLVRLRGFSTRGDIYLDGLRDIAQYNRDTFNQDRIEVLRGSASMLYGRGSTGGIINQVSKQPLLINQNEVAFTAGTDRYYRLTGDFNLVTGQDAALRVNVMKTDADSFRNGLSTNRRGIAPTFSWGIGTADEFSVGLYHLEYDDVPDFGFGWLNGRPVRAAVDRWYGTDSDYQDDRATQVFFSYTHRFAGGGQLKTTVRDGRYRRDLWSTTARFAAVPAADSGLAAACSYPAGTVTHSLAAINDDSLICRGSQTRGAKDRHRFVQTDYSGKFEWLGLKHELLAGAEYANEQTTTYSYTGTPAKSAVTWADDGGTGALADSRVRVRSTRFESDTAGLYAQDTLALTPHWKLIAGLRYDRFSGDYDRLAGPLSRTDTVWSRRFGVLYQPTDTVSWYASYGTSFNASGATCTSSIRPAPTPRPRKAATWKWAPNGTSPMVTCRCVPRCSAPKNSTSATPTSIRPPTPTC